MNIPTQQQIDDAQAANWSNYIINIIEFLVRCGSKENLVNSTLPYFIYKLIVHIGLPIWKFNDNKDLNNTSRNICNFIDIIICVICCLVCSVNCINKNEKMSEGIDETMLISSIIVNVVKHCL
jgi:hypothetical protein